MEKDIIIVIYGDVKVAARSLQRVELRGLIANYSEETSVIISSLPMFP